MNILITGGAGFIGSHVVRHFVNKYENNHIFVLDKLTYAGNIKNLDDIKNRENFLFIKEDITNHKAILKLFNQYCFDAVIHLAAESHVDRSIANPIEFIRTNVEGTAILLNSAVHIKKEKNKSIRFYHISTDEVYGTLGEQGYFSEETKYDPHSPYSASKAASDFYVRSHQDTFGLDTVISNCSNNYGPYQFPEKLIPLMINNIKNNLALPVYGEGKNIRDWLWVGDHVNAIDLLLHKGISGHTYNIGGGNEMKNIDLVKMLCEIMDVKLGREKGASEQLITYVKDRPGHDFRYAIDYSKIKTEFHWEPKVDIKKGLEQTVDWYMDNQSWLDHVISGEYLKYYEEMYTNR